MTCYQRHLRPLFSELDLEYDAPTRRLVDGAIRTVLGLGPEAHCPEIWSAIKAMPAEERAGLTDRVADVLGLQ